MWALRNKHSRDRQQHLSSKKKKRTQPWTLRSCDTAEADSLDIITPTRIWEPTVSCGRHNGPWNAICALRRDFSQGPLSCSRRAVFLPSLNRYPSPLPPSHCLLNALSPLRLISLFKLVGLNCITRGIPGTLPCGGVLRLQPCMYNARRSTPGHCGTRQMTGRRHPQKPKEKWRYYFHPSTSP